MEETVYFTICFVVASIFTGAYFLAQYRNTFETKMYGTSPAKFTVEAILIFVLAFFLMPLAVIILLIGLLIWMLYN